MILEISDIQTNEYLKLGALMVGVYAGLENFPTAEQQPAYYEMLKNIGSLSDDPNIRVLVARSADAEILGGVVYYSDMAVYGSGGIATREKNASGIRLLGVRNDVRGAGVGKRLAVQCINIARESDNQQIILHTTGAMKVAWEMYLSLGFKRSEDLDFMQGKLSVYGFRYVFRADKRTPPGLN